MVRGFRGGGKRKRKVRWSSVERLGGGKGRRCGNMKVKMRSRSRTWAEKKEFNEVEDRVLYHHGRGGRSG